MGVTAHDIFGLAPDAQPADAYCVAPTDFRLRATTRDHHAIQVCLQPCRDG